MCEQVGSVGWCDLLFDISFLLACDYFLNARFDGLPLDPFQDEATPIRVHMPGVMCKPRNCIFEFAHDARIIHMHGAWQTISRLKTPIPLSPHDVASAIA